MNAVDHVHVIFVLSNTAKRALGLAHDSEPPFAMTATALAQATRAVPGDIVHMAGEHKLFIVSHRVWDMMSVAHPTLQLVLDVLVDD